MAFTPTDCSQSTLYSLRVSEYRKDTTGKYILVGFATRDHQSFVMTLPDNTVPLITGPDKIYMADSVEQVTYLALVIKLQYLKQGLQY
jgi:hypothetical protein